MKKIILVFILLFLFVNQVSAHPTGYSFNKVVGARLIDIGYENDPFVANETSSFSFLLSDNKTGDPIEFSDVWVRIERGTQTVFATGIYSSDLASPTLLYTFPTEGEYKLNVRYEKEDESLAETVMPIKVVKEEKPLNPVQIAIPIAALVVGLGMGFGVASFKNRSAKQGKKKGDQDSKS